MAHTTQFIDLDDVRIAYVEAGRKDAETLVLSHSLFLDKRFFSTQLSGLADEFHLIAYDHRGHGESGRAPDRRYDVDAYYYDAAAFIEALALGPVHFAGNSLGGFVALRLAARRPDLVKSVIGMGTSGDREASNREAFTQLLRQIEISGGQLVIEFLRQIFFGATSLKDPNFAPTLKIWTDHFASLDPFVVVQGDGVVFRSPVNPELRHSAVPLLVLAGAEDTVYPPSSSEAIVAAAPSAEMHLIHGAGHSVALEQGRAVNAAILAFVAKHAG